MRALKDGNRFDEKSIEGYAENVIKNEIAPCYDTIAEIIANSNINYLMNKVSQEKDMAIKMYFIKIIEKYTGMSIDDLTKNTNFEDKV